jgi:hypothetical protein
MMPVFLFYEETFPERVDFYQGIVSQSSILSSRFFAEADFVTLCYKLQNSPNFVILLLGVFHDVNKDT